MFDPVDRADHVESHLAEGDFAAIAGLLGKLNPFIRQDCIDLIRSHLKSM